MVHHDAEVLDAIERGERAIIFNQGMVFVENDLSEADAEDRAVWLAHTGAELEGPLFTLSPTWLSCPANVLPRDEVIALPRADGRGVSAAPVPLALRLLALRDRARAGGGSAPPDPRGAGRDHR
jgi:hypothetical protein